MKKILVFAASTLVMACSTHKEIGVKKDSHGCNAAAGETWSELRKGCIQFFNEGVRLDPISQNVNRVTLSAFVILNSDGTKSEIFLLGSKSNIILNKDREGFFSDGTYRYDAETYSLYQDHKLIFRTNKAEKKHVKNKLIIYYDTSVGNGYLLEKIKEYKATVNYDYKTIHAIAISIPEDKKIEDAEQYFKNVKGVIQVNKNYINQVNQKNR